ncbi:hypothetical protein O6H91_13G062700 [Diphasiastrum complanatum]|uniref:Uncharacterized protein n=1 Tax=Diphasiastrum complanatum TaxID=34168 RepID=A0ACC2BVF0_DIPCM|nr:hypothetical protein O6H91_13G062700 [Diphasiastrum complanatum]
MRLGRSHSVREVSSAAESPQREPFCVAPSRQKSFNGTPASNGGRRQRQNAENLPPNSSPITKRAMPFSELSSSPLLPKSGSKLVKSNGSVTPIAGSPGLPPRPPVPTKPSPTPTKGLMNTGQTQNAQETPGSTKRKLRWEASGNVITENLSSGSIADSSAADSGVKVVVRVRPLSKREELEEESSIVQQISNCSMLLADQHFTYDAIAGTDSTQQSIFETVGLPMVENCLAGFNSSIFAYGQTGSGKTYTMWGMIQDSVTGILPSEERGLTPRMFEKLFVRIEQEEKKYAEKQLRYQCRCSFLEIYNEQITDLLDPTQKNLQIREDVKVGVYVDNLTEEFVTKTEDVINLLLKGLANRRVGATIMNNESSRSHSVFTCAIDCRFKSISDGMSSVRSSRINLVDLAGSERQRQTGAAGERLKEAGSINRSLSQLGNLINILAEVAQSGKQRHIPYRDSKLTFLLQDSLGGNAKLAMICAISPAISCKSETMSTLRFAQRAKAIQNKAVINEETATDANLLREQIRQLKDELMRMKSMDNQQAGSGAYSNGWNARRSYNLLRFSLNCPMTLPTVDSDTDEEMEIDEDVVESQHVESAKPPLNIDKTRDVSGPIYIGGVEKTQKISAAGIVDNGTTTTLNVEHEEGSERTRVGALEASQDSFFDCQDDLVSSGLNSIGEKPESSGLEIDIPEQIANLESPTLCASPRVNEDRNRSCTSRSSFAAEDVSLQTWASKALPSQSTELKIAQDADAANNNDDLDLAPKLKSPTPSISPELLDNKKRSSVSTLPLIIEGSSLQTLSSSRLHYPVINSTPSQESNGMSVVPMHVHATRGSTRNLAMVRSSKVLTSHTDRLAASLHRGLEIIENHQKTSIPEVQQSWMRFSFQNQELMLKKQVDKSVQTSPPKLLDTATSPVCVSDCSHPSNVEMSGENDQLRTASQSADKTQWQLVAISEPKTPKTPTGTPSRSASESNLNQAFEAVLAGAIRRECAAEEAFRKKEAELEQANRLVLQEKYDHHPEVTQAQIEQQRLYDELQRYRDFFDLGEREALQEEVIHLRNHLQAFLDSDTPRSGKGRRQSSTPKTKRSLLRLSEDKSSLALCRVSEEAPKETQELAMVVADHFDSAKWEEERKQWVEREAEWMSVLEELREESQCNKHLAEKGKVELEGEKRYSEELREALQVAMTGHARLLEQYAELQEKHINLLAKHRKIRDGVADVKRMATKAGLSVMQSKWLEAQAAQIVALNLEREQERQAAKAEVEGLQAQLRDTAEAVQAAGELLVRLKEAEEAVTVAQDAAAMTEQEADGLRREMEKLKRRHATELATLQQRLLEARLQRSVVCPMCVMAERVKFQFVEVDPETAEAAFEAEQAAAASQQQSAQLSSSQIPTGSWDALPTGMVDVQCQIYEDEHSLRSPDGLHHELDEDSCNL